ncbi:MAG: hypothetical protein KC621_27140 [Myxococcales bacterium]|nr:hypothetical protein [Myxococcales bacterium]
MALHDEDITEAILGAAILESAYRRCLVHGLRKRWIRSPASMRAQLLTYLRLSDRKSALLLLDFKVELLRDGITRRVL